MCSRSSGPGTQPQQRSIVAHFEGDRLTRIDAPDLPSEREFVASISRTSATGKTPLLELTPEQRAALPVPEKPMPPTATPQPDAGRAGRATIPPLEPN